MLTTPGHRLRVLQQRDPQQYPVLLSSSGKQAQGKGTQHMLFRALDEARVAHTPQQAAELVTSLSWRVQSTHAAPTAGAEGWVVYLAYEYAQAVWPHKASLNRKTHGPLCVIQRVKLEAVEEESSIPWKEGVLVNASDWQEAEPEEFLNGVARIQEYLLAGDVYQVNLSRRWLAEKQLDGAELYARLLRANAAPFAARACFPGLEIISSSPERLFEVRHGEIRTQPIAGTRPRGWDAAGDDALRAELIRSPKERAEHIMLVDLERNDLGRICRPGTVSVPRLMAVEPYATVQHIVSDVRGQLRNDVDLSQILEAVFPGGTITGCPKLHCMELLAGLESDARMAYTGSIGYCLDDGQADFNILIRTLQKFANTLRLDAGAGIVVGCDAQAELEETRAKARGVIRALAATHAEATPQ